MCDMNEGEEESARQSVLRKARHAIVASRPPLPPNATSHPVRQLLPCHAILLTRFHSRTSTKPHLIRPEEGRWFLKRMPVAPKECFTMVAFWLVNCRVDRWMDGR